MNLKDLSKKHPYYCTERNFYANEPNMSWQTMTEFLDEYENTDVDMNLIFRWDIYDKSVYENDISLSGKYRAEVFIMHQRKGIFAPHVIYNICEDEVDRFVSFLTKHWETIVKIWNPISN